MEDYYNEETGLDLDCLNAWAHLDIVHTRFRNGFLSEDQFSENLSKKVERYLGYVENQYPSVQEHKERAKSGLIDTYDGVVDEYNGLSLDEKKINNAHHSYRRRCELIIKGQNS
jgi:hypothetical protein